MRFFPGVLLFCVAFATSAAQAQSPDGDAFYVPPSPLPEAAPGTIIRSKALSNAAALPSAARNVLVLYHSRSIDGRDIAVSGTIAIPEGKAPAGGWPVTTWAHGTTGIGPACAPSRDTASGPEHAFLALKQTMMDDYARRGYVVVATDYEGLGGPGLHPFLQGTSEGRGVIDIVRAARTLDKTIGKRYVIVGHSQGGQAELFAASLGPSYAPALAQLGNAAMAPASHIAATVQAMKDADKPSYALGYAMYVQQSFASNHPAIDLAKILTPEALAHLPQTRIDCITKTSSEGYWATAIPKDQFVAGADLSGILKIAADNEPGALRIASPTLILQGTADDTVLPAWTDATVRALCKSGNKVRYRVYSGAGHETVVVRAAADIRSWVDARFARKKPVSDCADLASAAP